MTSRSHASSVLTRAAVLSTVFLATLILRVWGITRWFWMLGDQIRDWAIALGPFKDLPLVGPATHVSGYTVGPAFYWILWAIRVVIGPWFDNLPHAGGIGQAIMQSGADALLVAAVWKRTQSLWVSLAAITFIATASYDLALAPLVWNPVMGSTLAKVAMALVLLEWYRRSTMRLVVTIGIAWMAVHAYTGAIFVTVSVFAALLFEPLQSRDWAALRHRALAIAATVLVLQIPYALHQIRNRFTDSSMGAVTDSVSRILSGQAAPEISKSVAGLVGAVSFIQFSPWQFAWTLPLLAASAIVVLGAFRRDPQVICMTVLPLALAIAGYALFLSGLDNYYYLSLMPPAVLTIVLALTLPGHAPWTRPVGIALLVLAIGSVPSRVQFAATVHRMPEYAAIVAASRAMVTRGQALRGIETSFPLLPTCDPEFVYRILGGPIDPASPWIGVIDAGGGVRYRRIDG